MVCWYSLGGDRKTSDTNLPSFCDPKFRPEKLLEFAREVKKKLVLVEMAKEAVVGVVKNFKMEG